MGGSIIQGVNVYITVDVCRRVWKLIVWVVYKSISDACFVVVCAASINKTGSNHAAKML